MKKDRLATYTVRVPITFTFKARAELDDEVLWKMAESYAELILWNAPKAEYNNNQVEIVEKHVEYSREELEEQKRIFDEIFLKGVRK